MARAAFALFLLCVGAVPASAQFRVAPYLQNPGPSSMTVLWVTDSATPGALRCLSGAAAVFTASSSPKKADALSYSASEQNDFVAVRRYAPSYVHEVTIAGLTPGTEYRYEVTQGTAVFAAGFKTAPNPALVRAGTAGAFRMVVYGDPEPAPEYARDPTPWPDPKAPGSARKYLVDRPTGYAANLAIMRDRHPDLALIAGDIVDNGGLQRHWNEFWRQNTSDDPAKSFAGVVPILPVLGNHDYFAGPKDGGYEQLSTEFSVAKYFTYFRVPTSADRQGRYYRINYGPVALIVIDANNGLPESSDADSNHYLTGAKDTPPDFNPGSVQYKWLEAQLADAQRTAAFTFVAFHPCPYSQGPHGQKPGNGSGQDPMSGVPLRVLTPLFLKYGVDALLTGHDEALERSEIPGDEQLPGGATRKYTLQVYDTGIGGSELRAPVPGLENPFQKFLPHTDAPEVWQDGRLIDGGKHYGHLEIDVAFVSGAWTATFSPVYVFPILDAGTRSYHFERRVYKDVVTLTAR